MSATRGAVAGLAASVAQVAVGYVVDRAFLPRGHDNNIAPRLSERLFQRAGQQPEPVRDWTLGTVFHHLYGVGWGVLLAVAADRLRVPPPLLSPPVAVLIYGAAFSRVGIGTLTGTERHPDRRDPRKQRSLVTVAIVFPVVAGLILEGWDRRTARATGLSAAVASAGVPVPAGRG